MAIFIFYHECRLHDREVACGQSRRTMRNGRTHHCLSNHLSIEALSANNNIRCCCDKVSIKNIKNTEESSMSSNSNTPKTHNKGCVVKSNRLSSYAKCVNKFNELNDEIIILSKKMKV